MNNFEYISSIRSLSMENTKLVHASVNTLVAVAQEVEQVIYWKVGGVKSQHAIGCKSIKHVVQSALSVQVE